MTSRITVLHHVTGSLLLLAFDWTAAGPLQSEDAFFAEIPKVTSAARLEKSLLEMGMSVTIIDRETIAASPAIEIPDLLRLVPGLQVAHATGAVFAVGYHGANDQWPRRMEVRIDGRSVYLNTNSAVEWNALGIAKEDIEKIEVVRGPNSPSFGSNAVLGSINIITRAPYLQSGTYLRTTLGSQDTANGVIRWGGRLGDFESVVSAQYRSDDGFDNVNDDKQVTDLRLRSDYQLTPSDTLVINLGYTDGDVGADAPEDEGLAFGVKFDPVRDRSIRSHYQQLTWNREQPDDSAYRLNVYHQYYDHDDSYAPGISAFGYPPGTTLPLGLQVGTSQRYDIEFQHNLAPLDRWRLAWGIGGRYDKLESDLLLYGREDVSKTSGRVFGSAEWRPIDGLSITLDALTEVYEDYGNETSPRLGVNWMPTESRSFRANASRSHRVFTLLERYIDYQLFASNGDPIDNNPPDGEADTLVRSVLDDDARPEQVTAFEIGYTENWKELGLLLDVRVFHEQMDDAGSDPQDPDGVTLWRAESGDWDTTGVDVQLDYQPTRNTRLIGAYSYAVLDGRIADDVDANDNIIDYDDLDDTAPRHTLSLQASHRFNPQWSATLAGYYVDDVLWEGEGSEVDSYTRFDLKVARRFGFAGNAGEIALIVHNLADDSYNEFRAPELSARDGNVFERRAYLQMSLNFD